MIQSIGINTLSEASLNHEKERLKESCRQFETFLTKQWMSSMKETVMKAEEPDRAQEIYENMLDESFAGEMAEQGELGFADLIYESLLPLLESSSPEIAPLSSDGNAPIEFDSSQAAPPVSQSATGKSFKYSPHSAEEKSTKKMIV